MMKKTIIALMALSGVALSATELTYLGGNNGYDICTVIDGELPYIGMSGAQASESVLTSIKTVGDTTYSLDFNKDKDGEVVSFIVNDALYFNQIYTTKKVTSYTITFGAGGSLNAAKRGDVNWGGAIKFTNAAAVTFNVEVSAEQLNSVAGGNVFSRTIMNSTDTFEDALWNVVDKLSVNAIGLDNYSYAGLVTDINSLEEGQYGWMKVLSGDENGSSCDGINFVFRSVTATVPEPTTATLSLLALAGLAARRRRR